MIIVYGIPNCDTVKKARAWLTQHGLPYEFHDFKKQGVPLQSLVAWEKALGWDKLLNRKGTTWRKLDAAVQAAAVDAESAIELMRLHASVIKRPVVEWSGPQGAVTVGFDAESWAKRL
ncbi:MAG TPA: Spx/MgsR family RNA polymerase-binding regulatory protein [Polaromonas sp.]|uniref:Spx/MgsR family RNA polymerase-binding regulatory protein n=1 Tax=Polaromonas sp. TaxID=1869339 RepID=UPI002D4007AC|nr:Spx/MgsR family RNA polymerase-binding regulatory protein [Polaromonas sp.]HYW58114.1 Spx/MgsR family RNA polymerase-binding regulatory protein [Polaromonas sp.]